MSKHLKMEESDTLLMIPMKEMTDGSGKSSTDTVTCTKNFDGEKVPNVNHDTDEDEENASFKEPGCALSEKTDGSILQNMLQPLQGVQEGEEYNECDIKTEDNMESFPLNEQQIIPSSVTENVTIPLVTDLDTSRNVVDQSSTPRCESRTSIASTVNLDVCRICHCESEPGAPLISPCVCSGSLKYVHQSCLQQWIKSADTKSCELCKFDFSMTTKIKPFRKWQKLEMSTVERRKIMCSVTFHIIAITCVIWSLYVLIDKTTQEIHQGHLEWPFWTKLIVVAIGFTGGLVFMYVQCKMYVQLCRRWKAYNRVIYIQNLPDGNTHKIPIQPVYTQSKLHSPNNQTSLFSDTDLL